MPVTKGPIGTPITLPDGSVAPLSPGFAAGSLVFLSGQLPFDSDGALLTGDIAEQTAACLANIDQLLQSEGLQREHIVKATIWLTDVADFKGFNQAYTDFFGEHRPARSTVRSDLMLPGARVEIEVIAHRGTP